MSQNNEITTFHFLEEIQKEFLQQMENAKDTGTQYETRRIINFFENTATLQIIPQQDPHTGTNGSTPPFATLFLQHVSQEGEIPTFAIKIGVKPFKKTYKQIMLLNDEKVMKVATDKILGRLQEDMCRAAKSEAETSGATDSIPPAETPLPAETPPPTETPDSPPPSPEASEPQTETPKPDSESPAPEGGSSSRLRRRSLRNREQEN